jgi:hypothetical protein
MFSVIFGINPRVGGISPRIGGTNLGGLAFPAAAFLPRTDFLPLGKTSLIHPPTPAEIGIRPAFN